MGRRQRTSWRHSGGRRRCSQVHDHWGVARTAWHAANVSSATAAAGCLAPISTSPARAGSAPVPLPPSNTKSVRGRSPTLVRTWRPGVFGGHAGHTHHQRLLSTGRAHPLVRHPTRGALVTVATVPCKPGRVSKWWCHMMLSGWLLAGCATRNKGAHHRARPPRRRVHRSRCCSPRTQSTARAHRPHHSRRCLRPRGQQLAAPLPRPRPPPLQTTAQPLPPPPPMRCRSPHAEPTTRCRGHRVPRQAPRQCQTAAGPRNLPADGGSAHCYRTGCMGQGTTRVQERTGV